MSKVALLLLSAPVLSSASADTFMGRRVSQTLKFLSPLQSLTIFPKDIPTTTPRDEFLPKFKRGLEAETRAKDQVTKRRELNDEIEYTGKGWEKKSEESEKKRAEKEDQYIQSAYDRAIEGFEPAKSAEFKGSKYQFVGVVQPKDSAKKVKWYARKRPSNSKWNVRLVHVNRDVILRDMFVNGKVDVFAKYVNTGKPKDALREGENPSAPRRPLINAEYNIKKRSAL